MAKATYSDKLRQCNREALISVGALAATVLVWLACGFGLAGVPVRVLGIPLWAVCGTVGTWVFAIVVSVVMARWLFQDFEVADDLGDATGARAEAAAAPASTVRAAAAPEPAGTARATAAPESAVRVAETPGPVVCATAASASATPAAAAPASAATQAAETEARHG